MLASSTLISQSKSIKENESLCYYYNCQIHFLLTKMKKKQMKRLLSTPPFSWGLPLEAYSLSMSLSFILFFLPLVFCSPFATLLFISVHFSAFLVASFFCAPLNNLDFTVYSPTAKYRFIQACAYAKQRVWTLDLCLRHWSLVFACNNYSGTIMASSTLYTHTLCLFISSLSHFSCPADTSKVTERKKERKKEGGGEMNNGTGRRSTSITFSLWSNKSC